jgi:hypothetical protein
MVRDGVFFRKKRGNGIFDDKPTVDTLKTID